MKPLSSLAQYDFKSTYTDLSTNTTMLKDQSGNGLDGTVHSGCSIVNDNVMGNCMSFDGTNKGYVGLPDSSGQDFSKGLTLTAWINTSDPNFKDPMLVNLGTDTASYSLMLDEPNPSSFYVNYAKKGKNAVNIVGVATTPLKAGTWYHLAVAITADGKAQLYKNGQPIDSQQPLYAIPGGFSFTGQIGGYPGAANHSCFSGKIAWVSIYNSTLSTTEINQDMIQGEGNRTVSFRRSFPVDFQVYSINNNDQVQAIYIDNTGVSQDLYLEVTNNTGKTIDIPDSDGVFTLSFRPGTLSTKFLDPAQPRTLKLEVDPQEETGSSAYWTAHGSTDLNTGVQTIDFHLLLDTGENYSIESGQNITFTLPGAHANRFGGTRNTNVEFSYNLGPHNTGQLLQSLSVVSHLGQKDIPLHVDILGAPEVLNDGSTHNQLLFRIQNVGDKAISLSTSNANGISTFDINILTEPSGELVEWALVSQTDANSLSLQWPLVGVVSAKSSSTTVTLSHKVPQQIASGTTVIFKPPTGEAIFGKLSESTTTDTLTLNSTPLATIPKGSVVTAVSGIGKVGAETTTGPTKYIALADNLSQEIPSGSSLVWTSPSGRVETATLVTTAMAQQKEMEVGRKVGLAKNTEIYLLSPPSNWKIVQNATTPGQVQWAVTNQSVAELPKGASLEFLVQGIVCDLPSGQSAVTIAYSNIPGYWQGQFVVPVTKSPVVSSAQNVGVAAPPVDNAYLNVPYPQGDANGGISNGLIIGDTAACVSGYGGLAIAVPSGGSSQADPIAIINADSSTDGGTPTQVLTIRKDGSIDAGLGKITTTGEVSAGSVNAGSGQIQTTGNITSNGGNIGIGTSSPSHPLHLNATNVPQVGIESGANTFTLAIDGNGAGYLASPDDMIFQVGGETPERMRVTASGLVGIGTSSPAAGSTLDVNGNITGSSLTVNGAISAQSLTMSSGNQNLGIGTNNPGFPLHVVSVGAEKVQQGTQTYDGDDDSFAKTQGCSISAYCDHSVTGSRFIINSDQRIKHQLEHSDPLKDLGTLLRLRVTDFQFKDKSNSGNAVIKGLIAQELEPILPDAVIQLNEFLPNVYAWAKSIEHNAETKELTIHLEQEHELEMGDVLRLFRAGADHCEREVVDIPDPKKFVVKDWKASTEKLFVFGKRVDDLRAVDYNQVAMLGVSATQQLHKELKGTQKENKKLKKEVRKLKAQHEREIGDLKAELAAIKKLIQNL